jgi:hypothetical protein
VISLGKIKLIDVGMSIASRPVGRLPKLISRSGGFIDSFLTFDHVAVFKLRHANSTLSAQH